ncbi:helix-hairpin-helix domain-containing protein [Chitinibacter tainanensis]|uniref:ComEA family DNA-binding protein n=1 Tax=Chitinibacter tainanensis TaxID=230667 RepID=UPI0023533D82|nr:helix-hairpin-helix domain-containing protein [Chitinibacter tainanensis]
MFKKLLLGVIASISLSCAAYAAVDLNTATQQQLEALNGIGPQKAKDIIDYRSKNGPFKSAEDVMKVPGIKEGTFAKIKSEVTVGGKAAAAAPAKADAKATAKPADAKAAPTAKPAEAKAAKATVASKASAPAKK